MLRHLDKRGPEVVVADVDRAAHHLWDRDGASINFRTDTSEPLSLCFSDAREIVL